jgi:hypothetical protein
MLHLVAIFVILILSVGITAYREKSGSQAENWLAEVLLTAFLLMIPWVMFAVIMELV